MSGRPETADTYPFMIRHCKRSVAQRVQASAAARHMTVPDFLERLEAFVTACLESDDPGVMNLLKQYHLEPTRN